MHALRKDSVWHPCREWLSGRQEYEETRVKSIVFELTVDGYFQAQRTCRVWTESIVEGLRTISESELLRLILRLLGLSLRAHMWIKWEYIGVNSTNSKHSIIVIKLLLLLWFIQRQFSLECVNLGILIFLTFSRPTGFYIELLGKLLEYAGLVNPIGSLKWPRTVFLHIVLFHSSALKKDKCQIVHSEESMMNPVNEILKM